MIRQAPQQGFPRLQVLQPSGDLIWAERVLPALAVESPTPYRLSRVLKARTPPLYVSDAVLKQWFLRYFDAVPINSAGHLELQYGDRIREDAEAKSLQTADLRKWQRTVLKVMPSTGT